MAALHSQAWLGWHGMQAGIADHRRHVAPDFLQNKISFPEWIPLLNPRLKFEPQLTCCTVSRRGMSAARRQLSSAPLTRARIFCCRRSSRAACVGSTSSSSPSASAAASASSPVHSVGRQASGMAGTAGATCRHVAWKAYLQSETLHVQCSHK